MAAPFDESGLPPAQLDQDELRDHTNAVNTFRSLNFTETEANLLASARVEPWQAQHLLSKGCTHALAARILI